MSIMITGGGGFIGSHLARRLVEDGEEVVVFDISPDTSLLTDILDRIHFVQGDVVDVIDIMNTVSKFDVMDIFHTAAMLILDCEAKPQRALRVNVEGTVNILEVARLMDLRRVVFISSAAVFSPDLPEPVGDDAPKYPTTVYGATKLASELYGLKYARAYGVDFRALRFTWVYGPGRTRGATAFASLMVERPARGETIKVQQNQESKGDWLYVKDAVKALMLAREVDKVECRIYNIAGGTHRIGQVANLVRKLLPDARIEFESNVPVVSSSFDDAYAREELGWKPTYTIEKGVKDFIDEVRRKQGHESRRQG